MTATINSDAIRESEWIAESVKGLPLMFSPMLKRFPGLKHAFTTRLGGNSPPPLDSFNLGRTVAGERHRDDAIRNCRTLCRALALDFDALVIPGQVHSKRVVRVSAPGRLTEVDGITTSETNLPLLLHFADCVPIIIFAPRTKVLAVVHAGWRGTAERIAVAAVKLMKDECNCDVTELVAAIGPAIGSCCYPTGDDTAAKLKDSLLQADSASEIDAILFQTRNLQIHPNLKAINAMQLLSAGLRQIDISNACTACRPDLFYSHRQSNGQTGRQGVIASLI